MFWWLMTPFVGRNLDAEVAEARTEASELAVQRCVELSADRELAAAKRGYEVGKQEFRSGMHGSTIPDMLRIAELEQAVAAQQCLIEALMREKGEANGY